MSTLHCIKGVSPDTLSRIRLALINTWHPLEETPITFTVKHLQSKIHQSVSLFSITNQDGEAFYFASKASKGKQTAHSSMKSSAQTFDLMVKKMRGVLEMRRMYNLEVRIICNVTE